MPVEGTRTQGSSALPVPVKTKKQDHCPAQARDDEDHEEFILPPSSEEVSPERDDNRSTPVAESQTVIIFPLASQTRPLESATADLDNFMERYKTGGSCRTICLICR